MPVDTLFISGLADELNKKLSGARIDKIYMPRKDQVVLNLRTENGAQRLILSIGAYPAVWLTEEKYENPDVPPMFCMVLRKQIGNGRIISVTQPDRERMIIITLTATDEMGDISEKKLICELMGKQKNIVVVNQNGIITACLRNVGVESSDRGVLPGLAYTMPPISDKPYWMDLSEAQLANLFDNAVGLADAEKYICSQVSGLTLSMVRQALTAELPYKWLFDTANSQVSPYVVYKETDGKREVADISAVKPVGCFEKYDSFCRALDSFYGKKGVEDGIKTAKRDTERILANAVKRLENKLGGQLVELETAQKREHIKEKADLITANIGIIKGGEKLVRVVNYYDPLMPEINIELDPLMSPQQNAQKLYKKYARLKNAEKHLTEQIEKGRVELEYLKSLVYSLSIAENSNEINTVKEELKEAGLIKKDKKKVKLAPSAPRRYMSAGGFTILCGKNNRENDELTHKIASKKDLWFHARGVAGSHVILVTDGQIPSDEDIQQAASVAAYYCASNGVAVAVDYTLVKNVKKPNGARLGGVNYFEYKSVFVKPELPRNEA